MHNYFYLYTYLNTHSLITWTGTREDYKTARARRLKPECKSLTEISVQMLGNQIGNIGNH